MLQWEILSGTKSELEALLKEYESSTSAHSLVVICAWNDGATFYALVRYKAKSGYETH